MTEKELQGLREKAKLIRHHIIDMIGGSGRAGHLEGPVPARIW
ncbi:MAG: hypothetical protein ACOX27_11755 [Caldicoprobacterales bacterium]